jgi:opacity protein-like surface antigen
MIRTLVAAAGFAILAAPALAQPKTTWNGLPDRFQLDAGYFHLKAATVLTYQGTQGVDFEKDLGVDANTNTFWVDGTWRVGRRHQLKLGYTRMSRDRPSQTLSRDFVWGGDTYTAGLQTNSSTGSDILNGYYRFAAYRNDRFEIGPAIGIGYLWLRATIRATGTVGGVSRTIDHSGSNGAITGAIGAYTNAWLAKPLVLRGDFLYIKVSPGNSQQSVTDWRIGADYYFFHGAGLGVQYKYDKYREDRDILSTKLGGHLTFKGPQVFLSFLF